MSKWFPGPAAKGGLQDLVRATDAISTRSFSIFTDSLITVGNDNDIPLRMASVPTRRYNGIFVLPNPGADDTELATRLQTMRISQKCDIFVQQFSRALDLFRSSCTETFQPPRAAFDANPMAIEIDPFVEALGNLALCSAYSDLSHGRSASAIATLGDLLILSDRISLLSSTSGVLAPVFADSAIKILEPRLAQLSLDDCLALHRALRMLIDRTPSLIDQVADTGKFWEYWISQYIKERSSVIRTPSTGAPSNKLSDAALTQEIQNAGSANLQPLLDSCQSIAEAAFKEYLNRFEEPEKFWLRPIPDAKAFHPNEVTGTDSLALRIVSKVGLGRLNAAVRAALKTRTRLRLLDIHSMILAYRWQNAHLPANLEDVMKGLSADPLNGERFQFKLEPDGHYDLYSLGTPDTGPIWITERRLASKASHP